MIAMTSNVPANRMTRPEAPYRPVDNAQMPTIAKRNAPRNVDRAFCAVLSATSIWVARGVIVLLAPETAETIAVSEKVVTASMLDARMPRILSTASAPILALIS